MRLTRRRVGEHLPPGAPGAGPQVSFAHDELTVPCDER
jgi:hypothetical protein